MGRRIIRAPIRLDLDNSAAAPVGDGQDLVQQVRGDLKHVAVIERTRKGMHC
jgi:hypothetical protein